MVLKTQQKLHRPGKEQLKKNHEKLKVSGVILIDKPQGMTSQQVVSKVKYLFMSPAHNSKKAGHTGTLDPMATGLLPICLGEATKFSHYQLDADKSYEAIIRLGEQTDTGDAEGEITETKEVPVFSDTMLTEVCTKFTGDILQTPPMYSALKKDGKKLYEYARQGVEVEREARPITIKDLKLDIHSDCQFDNELDSYNEISLSVTCSKGTYVRVLGEDIAKELGTLGHLTMLRRTGVGSFIVGNAITLDALEALSLEDRFNLLMPVDVCIGDLPCISLTDEEVLRVRNGQRLNMSKQIQSEWFAVSGVCTEPKISNDNLKSCKSTRSDRRDLTDVTMIDVKMVDASSQFLGLATLEVNGRMQPKKVVHL